MKQPFLLALLVIATFFYFYEWASPSLPTTTAVPAPAVDRAVAAPPVIIVAAAPPSYSRWKTGPNAQTDFEPFAPNEHTTWNKSSGYTIIGGSTR